MKVRIASGHLENEIHFQRGRVPRRLKPPLIMLRVAARLKAAPFQNGC
jgi:hypothetical protein